MNINKKLHFYREYFVLKNQSKNSQHLFPFTKFYPILNEKDAQSGTASGHYFHQDFLIARKIFRNAPEKHIDVGSRIDGFVAHVAVFRPIYVLDVRPLQIEIENIHFIQADLMKQPFEEKNICDSLSCLHALEHFGLGRYGDPLDYDGYLKGFDNLYQMVKKRGKFYFSVPIGPQRIEFNAHRVFSVQFLLDIIRPKYSIDSFSYVDDVGHLIKDANLYSKEMAKNYNCHYGCGIFELTKL